MQLKQIEQVLNWLKTFIHRDITDTDIVYDKEYKKRHLIGKQISIKSPTLLHYKLSYQYKQISSP
jgi:hypothetical protein